MADCGRWAAMEWGDIAELCHVESVKIRDGLRSVRSVFGDGSATALLLKHETATTERVEYAVRTYAADRRWPELTDIEKLMLSLRLDFAASLAALLSEQPRPFEDEAGHAEERLGWLMLFAWDQYGFPQLQQTIEQFLEGDTAQPAGRPNAAEPPREFGRQ